MKNKAVVSLLIIGGLISSSIIQAEEKKESLTEMEVAQQALKNMSAHIRSLGKFSIYADVYIDEVLENGLKVQLNKNTEVFADLPSKFKIISSTMTRSNEFYYNGSEFTMYTPHDSFYVSLKAPETVGKLINMAQNKYDLDIPLSDLFLWGSKYDTSNEIESALIIGVQQVNGVSCNQFAFRQKDVDWQICIQRGEEPLPLKLVITSKQEETQPQYIAILKWDTAPLLLNQSYTFVPKSTDVKIKFVTEKTDK